MDVIVRQGDSLWYYSQLFQLHHTLLIDSNRNIQPNLLSIGQQCEDSGICEYGLSNKTRGFFMEYCC